MVNGQNVCMYIAREAHSSRGSYICSSCWARESAVQNVLVNEKPHDSRDKMGRRSDKKREKYKPKAEREGHASTSQTSQDDLTHNLEPSAFGPAAVTSPSSPEFAAVGDTVRKCESESGPAEDKLSIFKAIPLPARPGYGKIGQKVQLYVNHFRMESNTSQVALHDVAIVPPLARSGRAKVTAQEADRPLPKRLCRTLLQSLASSEGWKAWAYDGQKALYTPAELKGAGTKEGVTYAVQRPEELREGSPRDAEIFQIKIKFTMFVDLRRNLTAFIKSGGELPQASLQALDTVMRHERALQPDWISAGRNFLNSNTSMTLGCGLEVWLGYTQSVRPAQGGVFLVVDRAAGAFVTAQSAVDLLKATLDQMPGHALTAVQWKAMNRAFKGLKVELTHLPGKRRRKLITGLSRLPASDIRFRDDQHREWTVPEYFQETYGKKLLHQHLPCLAAGTAAKPVYFPVEMCQVLGGQRKGLVTEGSASAAMIKATAQHPDQKWPEIESTLREIILPDQTLNAFQVAICPDMTPLTGRILPPPKLLYKGDRLIDPQRGEWRMESCQLHTACPVQSLRTWMVLDFDVKAEADTAMAKLVAGQLQKAMLEHGIRAEAAVRVDAQLHGEAVEQTLQRVMGQQPAVKLVVCLLPGTGRGGKDNTHARIKQVMDREVGVVTQCLLAKHCRTVEKGGGKGGRKGGGKGGGKGDGRSGGKGDGRGGGKGGGKGGAKIQDPTYLANVILKINAKLGGTNVVLAPQRKGSAGLTLGVPLMEVPTILFGADVTHPAPGSDASSIAAVTGSIDGLCARYAAQLSVQQSRQETIDDLQPMAHKLFLNFLRTTRKKPERVVFFRDGVSEGQFQQILLDELPKLRAACAQLDEEYRPPITFVVVQKRHNTRLFLQDPGQATDRSGNVPPGTVVDTTICHPQEYDFYLQSHAGIQGTTHAVHYHVLADENQFGADALQHMCYSLCYLYCRCTRSVSLVPPVYYAHHSATRGREYEVAEVEKQSDGGSATSKTSSGICGLINTHEAIQGSMYFA
ncbi:Protein argonaute-3 [Cymbomonas tetramitiformis]|uniref:Protein argonaute-3 n=1 Tax=Cymbomonas tetramitiformis TaxID=36881 RepID=A0AAE0LE69_9CHLO|nr:Protein argonaute-3 [Cymbomonas tetramitiformis]